MINPISHRLHTTDRVTGNIDFSGLIEVEELRRPEIVT